MGYIFSFCLRPIRFFCLIFRKWTFRGTRYHIYLKSGNVLTFDAEEVTLKCSVDGGYSSIEWTHCNLPNERLITVDVNQIEAVSFRNNW